MDEVFTAALVGGLIGTFFGGFSKFLWERWLPDWLTWRRTQRMDREHQLSIVRAPAIRAFSDLHWRLFAIISNMANEHKYAKSVGEGTYYVDSTAYLVGRAFAWQEILRRRMAAYDYAELYTKLELLTTAFSHGRPGFQVFRHQQTEIGERLIVTTDGGDSGCMALSDFLDLLGGENPPHWIAALQSRMMPILDDPANELVRAASIDDVLTNLVGFLDPKGRWHQDAAAPSIDISDTIDAWQEHGMISGSSR